MTDYRLDTNGPHSGDYTRHVADALAESVHVLNHHTMDADALPDPAVIYDLLGSLFTATVGVDQLLRQVEERLGAMAAATALNDAEDGTPIRDYRAWVEAASAAQDGGA